jgi:hypothetical protein
VAEPGAALEARLRKANAAAKGRAAEFGKGLAGPAVKHLVLERRVVKRGAALEGSAAEPRVAREGREHEIGVPLESRAVERGAAVEGRMLKPGIALEAGPLKPTEALDGLRAVEGRVAEVGTAFERRTVECGEALEGHTAELGDRAFEDRVPEINVASEQPPPWISRVHACRFQDARQLLSADAHVGRANCPVAPQLLEHPLERLLVPLNRRIGALHVRKAKRPSRRSER